MGLLSATARTVLDRPSYTTRRALSITTRAGVRHLARRTFSSDTDGLYYGRVERWSPVSGAASKLTAGLQPRQTKVLLDNTDRSLDAIAEGDAALLRLSILGVPYAEWPPEFIGLVERINPADSLRMELELRVPDMPARRSANRVRYTLSDWPRINATTKRNDTPQPNKALGEYVPTYWGKQDSSSAGQAGSVNAVEVDTRSGTNNFWVCMFRAARTIMRVYNDGTLLPSTDWTHDRVVRNGRMFSGVRKATGGRWTGTITVDLEGVEEDGDGTGDLIDQPTAIILDILDNHVWGDYRSGARLTGLAPVNAAYLAESAAFFVAMGLEHKGGFQLTGSETGLQVLDRWLLTWPWLRAAWTFKTGAAQIGIRPLDLRTYDPTDPALPWLRTWLGDTGAAVDVSYDRERALGSMRVHYLESGVAGDFLRSIEVRDPDSAFGAAADEMTADGLTDSLG